jgi:hypothetical protein
VTGALNWAVDEIGAAFGVLDDHWWPTQAARSAAETYQFRAGDFTAALLQSSAAPQPR